MSTVKKDHGVSEMGLINADTPSWRVQVERSKSATISNDIAFSIGESILGKVLVTRGAVGVCAILLGSNTDGRSNDLAARFPANRLVADEQQLPDDLSKVLRFIAGGATFLKRCHDQDETRPTPLPLQYVPGNFNCRHQDLYGDLAFPIQVAILLSEQVQDFAGGEFVLTERRSPMESPAEVVPLRQGDAVAVAAHRRPVQDSKGNYRVDLRHGVSRVRSGMRHTVGIIFHDAK
jgi:hypothetical protein